MDRTRLISSRRPAASVRKSVDSRKEIPWWQRILGSSGDHHLGADGGLKDWSTMLSELIYQYDFGTYNVNIFKQISNAGAIHIKTSQFI